MAYDYEMAQRLRRLGRYQPPPAWHEAVCAAVSPPAFSVMDGNALFTEENGLTMTATAAAREWHSGDKAAAVLSGGSLLVIDKI